MFLMSTTDGPRTARTTRPLALCLAIPVALCALLLTGCAGGTGEANQPGTTSQDGGSPAAGDEGNAADPQDGGDGPGEGGAVELGGVKVDTRIPDDFPDDLPLPQKAPTSVVTVGDGLGKIGGGVSLNYDGVSIDEVEQMLKDAEVAGYRLDGPFDAGSSQSWGLRKDTVGVMVLFSDGANLSLTVTSAG